MSWLVTGGAGYIGAHVVRALAAAGLEPSCSTTCRRGSRASCPPRCRSSGRASSTATAVARTIDAHSVTGVIHVAGFKYAGVSVQRPLHTYEQNVTGTATLLAVMADRGVDRMVFSSSAAVYGTPDVDLVTEESPCVPESPYGESKLIGEWLLRDQAVAAGLRHTSLRYFNVVGSGDPTVYDASPHNLFPLVFDALVDGRTPQINGNDYPTPDGTNVRDYIHVADLAVSHMSRPLVASRPVNRSSRRTTSAAETGVSVAEIMTAIADVTGHRVHAEIAPSSSRRSGAHRRER